MIKISVLYPAGKDTHFDMKYYLETHITLVKTLLGEPCRKVSVEKGVTGTEPGSIPEFITMGHLHFDSIEDFQKAFAPHANVIGNDIKNFTNVVPKIQISEVVM